MFKVRRQWSQNLSSDFVEWNYAPLIARNLFISSASGTFLLYIHGDIAVLGFKNLT